MNTNRMPTSGRGVKLLGAAVAVAAVVTAGALTVALDRNGSGHFATLAGSGDGASGGIYVPPSVGNMNTGATATFTTPSSVPAVTEAVPAVKAG
jgi:hypothetical protein